MELIAIASIGRAVGLEGLCAVETYGTGFEQLEPPCTVLIGRDQEHVREITLLQAELRPRGYACAFEGFGDRTAIETLRGTMLFVPADSLPGLNEAEYYHFELEGMKVFADTGEYVGTVKEVQNYPSMDALDVLTDDGSVIMVPLKNEAVAEISRPQKRITVRRSYLEELL